MEKDNQYKGSTFSLLGAIFRAKSITSVLVGGYALCAHKIQRMTFDIDFMITLTDYNIIESDVLKIGYSVFNRSEAFAQLKADKFVLRDIDFLICDPDTVHGLVNAGQKIEIAGEIFVVPSLLHIIAMKIHSVTCNRERELKDFPDIVQLLKLNNIDPESKDIKELFIKYNAMELYEKVVETTKNIG
jgi:hypothetical protein